MKKLVTMMSVAVLLVVSVFVLTACGSNGKNGTDGNDGKSAYQIWLDNGNTGTENDFLNWLKGTHSTHTWSDWVTISDPTATTDGYDMRVCSVNGHTELRVNATAGLKYEIFGTTAYSVSKGTANISGTVIIPARYNGLPVTRIYTQSDQAFLNCSLMTEIIIPSSVTYIAEGAFEDCTSLNKIVFTGTMEQWNNITKGTNWKSGVPATMKIHCTDGII